MLIGHYMHDLWAPGGVATYIARLSNAQRDLGHEVRFFDSIPNAAEATPVRTGDELAATARAMRLDVLHLHLSPPGGLPRGTGSVRTVHGHQPYCPSGTQFLSRSGGTCERRAGLLPCTWGHLVDGCGSRRLPKMVDDFRRTRNDRAGSQTSLLLANSDFVRHRLLRAGFDPSRVRVLLYPAPVRLPEAGSATGSEPRFLFMGRLTREKGLRWLFEALARTDSAASLDIAGEGGERPKLEELAKQLGIEGRVRFHGWLDRSALAQLCASARAVVVPSLWHEPAGLVAIEAATYGRPVIASQVGGLTELVQDGTTGLVVSPSDLEGLATAITRLTDDPTFADALGSNGKEIAASRFSLDTHLEALFAAYREVFGAS